MASRKRAATLEAPTTPKKPARTFTDRGPQCAVLTPSVDTVESDSCVDTLDSGSCLYSIDESLTEVRMIGRPSVRNRSPYVADVQLADGRVAICHVPSFDMGGKCVAGASLLVKLARDAKGRPIGPDAVSPKYGTPKCEYIAQLLRVCEPESAPYADADGAEAGPAGVWVGAHPALGERVAQALLESGALENELGPFDTLASEVSKPLGLDLRVDFELRRAEGVSTLLEVKHVVDTDYAAETAPAADGKKTCVYIGRGVPYQRAAIFPWGRQAQKGPDGEKVVSARAIKHVDCLAAAAASGSARACVLFIALRPDVASFRPNSEACPSFGAHLALAKRAGVQCLARRIRWSRSGRAYDAGSVDVVLDG